jgi:ribosomal-protein-alanine N-acetyltransferase
LEAKVRIAVESDIAAILAIERGSETAPHWPEVEYKKIVRGDGPVRRALLVAEVNEVVGFAVGNVVAGIGELENLAVGESFRGRGVGRALSEAVLDWCREQGAEAVELEVREGSRTARRLYERLGFAVVGERRSYYSRPEEVGVLYRIGLRDTPSA